MPDIENEEPIKQSHSGNKKYFFPLLRSLRPVLRVEFMTDPTDTHNLVLIIGPVRLLLRMTCLLFVDIDDENSP